MSTNNMFWVKKMSCPCEPHFYYFKVGFNWAHSAWASLRDAGQDRACLYLITSVGYIHVDGLAYMSCFVN